MFYVAVKIAFYIVYSVIISINGQCESFAIQHFNCLPNVYNYHSSGVCLYVDLY